MSIKKKWNTILNQIKAQASLDTYRSVAEDIGINYVTLWRLVHEKRSPSIDLVLQIEEWYDQLTK